VTVSRNDGCSSLSCYLTPHPQPHGTVRHPLIVINIRTGRVWGPLLQSCTSNQRRLQTLIRSWMAAKLSKAALSSDAETTNNTICTFFDRFQATVVHSEADRSVKRRVHMVQMLPSCTRALQPASPSADTLTYATSTTPLAEWVGLYGYSDTLITLVWLLSDYSARDCMRLSGWHLLIGCSSWKILSPIEWSVALAYPPPSWHEQSFFIYILINRDVSPARLVETVRRGRLMDN